MIISIDYIKDAGSLEKERIVFAVNEDGQLGKFVIAESQTLDESKFSSLVKNPYWFPDRKIKVGDRVVLYTKKGVNNVVDNKNGTHTYFYYWGLENSHLVTDRACVVLFETSWIVSVIPKDEE